MPDPVSQVKDTNFSLKNNGKLLSSTYMWVASHISMLVDGQ